MEVSRESAREEKQRGATSDNIPAAVNLGRNAAGAAARHVLGERGGVEKGFSAAGAARRGLGQAVSRGERAWNERASRSGMLADKSHAKKIKKSLNAFRVDKEEENQKDKERERDGEDTHLGGFRRGGEK
jgi:hypothetical protein